ncbi:hypothetical protein DPV78_011409 [Talaromyces pinophilus]|nr:hypothetical protein DPV78_011409 [Talaromyces pinophilus]
MEMNYDVNTLHQLEAELEKHIYAGTEVMTDVASHHFVKSSNTSTRVLVPQPSSDPCDPLNWSPKWKLAAIGTTTFMSLLKDLLNVGLLGLLLILLLFLFPETKWHQKHNKLKAEVDDQNSAIDEKETTHNIEDPEIYQEVTSAELNVARTADLDPYLYSGSPLKKQSKL